MDLLRSSMAASCLNLVWGSGSSVAYSSSSVAGTPMALRRQLSQQPGRQISLRNLYESSVTEQAPLLEVAWHGTAHYRSPT
jgi:hypothetical protein